MKQIYFKFLMLLMVPYIAEAQQLKINEVMASNTVTLASDLGNFGDWVELYNLSSADIDLSGLYFTDDITNPTKYQLSSGSVSSILPANGYKLIWADDSAQGLHANFKLNGTTGETIAIFAADGITLIDSVSFGVQTSDVSYGRSTDGGPNWTLFNTSTPNATNGPTTIQNNLASVHQIKIYPNPTNDVFFAVGSKWQSLEIIDITGKVIVSMQSGNPTQQAIDITNLEKGLYFVQLTFDNANYTEHLIKN